MYRDAQNVRVSVELRYLALLYFLGLVGTTPDGFWSIPVNF